MISIDEIVIADEPASWELAGFTVERGLVRVGAVWLRLAGRGDGRTGIVSWSLRNLPETCDLDGLVTARSARDIPAAEPVPAHPNGAFLLDHLVITTDDVDRTVAAFRGAGCEPRRERLGETMRQVFIRAGEVILEIVGAPQPSPGAGHATLWGLAFSVHDLDSAAQLLGDAIGATKNAVQPGRRIATLSNRSVGISVPVALMSP